jgi:hypothetical protein
MEKNNKIKNKSIVIFSHDAGGAQILSSYLSSKNILNVYGICKGPAVKIFKEKNIKIKKISIKEAVKICEIFITTTSWKSNLEKNIMKELCIRKKKFITFLDHWVHFKKRFNKKYLPTELWCFDKQSYLKAKKIFKKTEINLKKNFFHDYALKKILSYKKSLDYKNNFLYLTEPISDLYLKLYNKKVKISELDALEFFLKKCKTKKINITIRVHPNDTINKYRPIQKKFNKLNIKFDNKTSIYRQLAKNYNIVSYQSSILNLAFKNKNRVLTSTLNKKLKIHYLKKNNHYIYNYDRF